MKDKTYDFGMIGIGTMGRNLVLNMSDHGYSVAAIDRNQEQVEVLKKENEGRNVFATTDPHEFINSLKTPRAIIMLVPAGKIVDAVIQEYLPLLSEGDLLMDWGNSHYTDTNARIEQLEKSKIHFMGVGISGGESGARHGPSIMPGGPKDIFDLVASMLDSIAAKVDNEPCTAWLGPGSAGHYVKMVHNGIEYGLMQLIAECYHILKELLGMDDDELHHVFTNWNQGKLHSFLLEITADIFIQQDEITGQRLIEKILDSAHQKGTGGWTSEDAMELQVPIPVIDIAVSMRNLSAYKKDRMLAGLKLKSPKEMLNGNKSEFISSLEEAFYFSMITTYAQGMALLQVASGTYQYNLNLETIARIWRGGCIIRASLLEDIRLAYSRKPDLSNILLDDNIAEKLQKSQEAIRKVIHAGIDAGIPLPAMMGSLAYFDSYRSSWLPASLIQAQRDYFGAHTYERNDREGTFHTIWNHKED
ncbi:MAG: NADP-dependent phosphogluconate dehydrogenase [Saprospiraceae bacterium]|uniref:6-phosphogluconate dehydrogenase, decarboxylating n=1 Tax=Candidatus Opimibacter skivensis TaxID=2982028 RepID=A0A9D7SXB7_9BACT|nr:NADP-dependent phosphogluconate dehydrogenase [Candidatus Opimibacter skivensis]